MDTIKNRKTLTDLKNDEQGLTTVEYIIILFLIAVSGIAIWNTFGDTIDAKVGEADGEINALAP